MSGESQQVPQSEPDPSVLTTEQLQRGLRTEREITDAQLDTIRQRLDGIDKATKVLDETVNRTPTEIQKEVGHLKELVEKELANIREAAAKQDQVNQKAIDKAEIAAKESGSTSTGQIADLKERVGRIEDKGEGGRDLEARQIARLGVVAVVLGILGFLGFNSLNDNSPAPDPIVVEVTVVAP